MTLYTNTKNTSSVAKIVSIDKIGKTCPNNWTKFCSRESTYSQSHEANVAVLQVVHRHLKIKQPFESKRFTGSGRVGASTGKRYFDWLERMIRTGLPSKGTLYLFFVTRSRLFRPLDYNYDDVQTWNPTQADYDNFDDWLCRSFGNESERPLLFGLHCPACQMQNK